MRGLLQIANKQKYIPTIVSTVLRVDLVRFK